MIFFSMDLSPLPINRSEAPAVPPQVAPGARSGAFAKPPSLAPPERA
jgi:hypothetical protein